MGIFSGLPGNEHSLALAAADTDLSLWGKVAR